MAGRAAARASGVTGVRRCTGHGDQSGQQERRQGDQPGGAIREQTSTAVTDAATERATETVVSAAADTMAGALSDATKSARDFHGVPLTVMPTWSRSVLTIGTADAAPSKCTIFNS